jgi:hypothetical protein
MWKLGHVSVWCFHLSLSKWIRALGVYFFVGEHSTTQGISKYQQLKKKSAATALNIVLASAHIQMI